MSKKIKQHELDRTILILGGDGYLGWPLAMKVAIQNPQDKILIVDNEWRRNTVVKSGYSSGVPICSPSQRISAFGRVHGQSNLLYMKLDINSRKLEQLIKIEKPAVVYHLAHQPSAPYSMKGPDEAIFTLQNNESGNLRLLWALKKYAPDAHLVKLGSLGVYSKGGIEIPEGYFIAGHNGRWSDREVPFPREADDVYHISKINDSNYVGMATRMWGLRITDVLQSTIYGTDTDEMQDEPALFTRLDYDDMFGTVLNRFMAQAVSGLPLTIYGTGQQRCGLMPLQDVVTSLAGLIKDPAQAGKHKVINHVTEKSLSINEIAAAVRHVAVEGGYPVEINREFDPRGEDLEVKQEYVINTGFLDATLQKSPLNEQIRKSLKKLSGFKQGLLDAAYKPKISWKTGDQHDAGALTPKADGELKTYNLSDSKYWEAFRKVYFPSNRVNLNPGTLGTTSVPVLNARTTASNEHELEAYPLGSYQDATNKLDEIVAICHELWPSRGYEPVVTNSISQTMNLLALAMLRAFHKKGAGPYRVVTTCHEHKGGIGCFENLPEYEVHYLSDAELVDEIRFKERITELKPHVAFFSQVYYDTGRKVPADNWVQLVKEVSPECRLLLDCAQSVGLYSLPFGDADALVSSAHKWLYGPHGGGLMWVKNEFLHWLEGLYWNGSSITSQVKVGTLIPNGGQDFQLYSAILESLKLYKWVGEKEVLARSAYLADIFRERLSKVLAKGNLKYSYLDDGAGSPVICLAFTDYDPYPLYNYLNQHMVHVKCIKDHEIDGVIYHILRIGIPYFESIDRLDYVAGEVEYFLQ